MEKYIFLNPVSNPIIPDKEMQTPKLVLHIEKNLIEASITVNSYTGIKTYQKSYNLSNLKRNIVYSAKFALDGFFPVLTNDEYEIKRNNDEEAFRFYISEDGSLEMECFPYTEFKDTENMNIGYSVIPNSDNKFHFSYYLKEKYPEYNNCYSVEKDFLDDVLIPNKSLSYMDAQIDIITKFLMEIIEKNKKVLSPESKKIYENFKEIFNETSLLNSVSIEKLKNKMRHKKTTREFQKYKNNIEA